MAEEEKKKKTEQEPVKEPEKETPAPEEVQAIRTTEFMKETIKSRPINKRKLIRRILTSVVMAVVMGLVACITFVLLEPVINRRINAEEGSAEIPTEEIRFAPETEEEETLPEDMIADESELAPPPIIIEQTSLDDQQIEEVLSKIEYSVEDYVSMNRTVTDRIKEVLTSVVDVVGITKDTDLFEETVENEHIISGVVVADNGQELLILADMKEMTDYDSLEVVFNDDNSYPATIKKHDTSTGLAVIAVNKSYLSPETRSSVTIIEMGSSANRNMGGTPIIALGRPLGNVSSICFGTVSSISSHVEFVDGSYSRITTDIYGSTQASGILINARGQLVGIIDMSYNSQDLKNLIAGLGITDLKKLVETMSNGREIPYFGIYGEDVTDDTAKRLDVPVGVYIKSLEPDSPMLDAGMQSGDIITHFGGINILSYQELKTLMLSCEPEQPVLVEFVRQGTEGNSEMSLTVIAGKQE